MEEAIFGRDDACIVSMGFMHRLIGSHGAKSLSFNGVFPLLFNV